MELIKRIIIITLMFSIICLSVNAEETKTVSFLATMDDENVSIVETDVTSEVNNAALLVRVIKYINDVETVIYEGPLGNYDNGLWNYTDFSSVDYLVLLDWQNLEYEPIYIIPINNINMNKLNKDNYAEQMLSKNSEIIYPSMNIVEKFYINNTEVTSNFVSQNITGDDNLFVKYTITNSGSEAQSVQLLMCIYSLEGRMLDMAIIQDTIAPNETKDIEKNLTVSSDISSCYAKVFLWDGLNTLRPLHNTLQIGSENASIEVATVTVDCTLNKEYNLVTTVENMPTNDDGQYTITYNPSKLELVDLCSLTYKKELTDGVINGTNISIVSVDTTNGKIVFKNPNADVGNVSKVLNSFKFRGLVSNEQTTITIEYDRRCYNEKTMYKFTCDIFFFI